MAAQAMVLDFGMGVDVHGEEGTKAACRAVSDAIRHSSEVTVQGGLRVPNADTIIACAVITVSVEYPGR